MATSNTDSKKYYWIKIKTNFLTSRKVDFLMRQKDGANYVILYQVLCLLAANTNGVLADKIGEFIIPFNIEKIHGETKGWFPVDTIRVGLDVFQKLGLVQAIENNILKINKFDEIVGSETGAAIRKRNQRGNNQLGQIGDNVPQEERGKENKSIELRDVISNTRDTRILDNTPLKEINLSSPARAVAEKNKTLSDFNDDDEEEISDEELLSCLDKNATKLIDKAREDEDFSFKNFKDWFDAENIKSKTNPSAYFTKVFDKVLLTGLFSKKRIEALAETIRIAKTPWLGENN